ncbi:alpha/beta hydrolase-fold protein [Thalassotalea sp. G2M2-11]|uniref:alpha/beta hydrolase-fold protein n=1 Tax=Thalassotalea sp. G2M2-11 TaxID=2787627 RepID=UPI0019D05C7C|nr:alpha/beta hydrolase-fold protein [Thalassotalea sp. G2M2-11]
MKRLILIILLSIPNLAAAVDSNISIGNTIKIESEILKEQRSIQIHLPDAYLTSKNRFPVLYLTDGPGHFSHTVGTMNFLADNGRIPQMIIVGVANTDRTRDLTPKILISKDERFQNGGGADNFLEFFEQELIPYIEKNYRTQPYRVFSGHSFGGLFAINAFLTKPQLFNAYISVSPSLWWDEQRLIDDAKTFFNHTKSLERTLFVTMAAEGDRMITPYNNFVNVAKENNVDGLIFANKEFDDEDHGSTVLRSQYFGLKQVWDGWLMPRETFTQGLSAVQAHYKGISSKFGFDVNIPEGVINNLGYNALGNKNLEDALEIFTYNVELYPNSANVYDSLADAQEKVGQLNEAYKNYSKALKMAAPDDTNKVIFEKNKERVAKLLASESITMGK